MREITTESIKVGEHIIVDGVEYVTEEFDANCSECALHNSDKCDSVPCDGIIFKSVKKETKYRPYKDTEEMIADYKERFKVDKVPSFCMPLIWVTESGICSLITSITLDHVIVYEEVLSMEGLLETCTYLDGSPCGKVEE